MNGPLIRLWYRETTLGGQVHCLKGSPKYPQGQGFIAPTSMKLAGKLTLPWARLIVTTLSSSGWRSVSSKACPNSGSSSRKRIPRWLRLISPGFGKCPPPTSPAFDIVWCGDRKGLCLMRGVSDGSNPLTLYILVTSSDS